MAFIRRYLQHVLPTGFMKISYYGFMGSGSSVTLDDVRAAIELSLDIFIEDRSVPKNQEKTRHTVHIAEENLNTGTVSILMNSGDRDND